jgi:hypothetical protein
MIRMKALQSYGFSIQNPKSKIDMTRYASGIIRLALEVILPALDMIRGAIAPIHSNSLRMLHGPLLHQFR